MHSKKPKLKSKKAEKFQRGIERMEHYAEATREQFAQALALGKTFDHTGPIAGRNK